MKKILISLIVSLAFATAAHAADTSAVIKNDYAVVMSKQGTYDKVKQDLLMAIENRGLKINHVNHTGDMLKRTGPAVGDTREIYGQAEQVEFCKADVSRSMMEADPTNIVFCPYLITLYTLPNDPGKVYIAYRKPVVPNPNPATAKALVEVEALYAGIVKDTLEGAF